MDKKSLKIRSIIKARLLSEIPPPKEDIPSPKIIPVVNTNLSDSKLLQEPKTKPLPDLDSLSENIGISSTAIKDLWEEWKHLSKSEATELLNLLKEHKLKSA